ncbi:MULTISPECIES: ABC transporter substrate-binding protein [Ramlibacter]|uniref:ABC transporter substrate-binding protein n=1 Tax=Ramlibacter aquaticus TaxID=2780094 RepID=A0ABR9SFI0_9BURK|nr:MULTISPECIES: ABC transporter substrate-binding protein [Ramlibacter]MBE7941098.1 ABC transporter substrate-binding protein [Ramlibacter aquaticus]
MRKNLLGLWSATALAAATLFSPLAAQAADGPIKIGVIAEAQAVAGSSIGPAAQLAADEINAKGGINGRKIEVVVYDNHSSAAESVRAFQRAVNEDKVNAVIASYISEVVLALEPWAARLKTVMITPGAASDAITGNIAKDYNTNKYTFHGYLTSSSLAGLVCDAAKDLLVDGKKMKTAVIMSEDAAWTSPLDAGYEACLPKVGLKVLDHIRFSPDTTDFTPIFKKIEDAKPDVIITGISHVGTQPTVQWKSQQIPIPMFGISSQATNSTFWKDTNGATEGVLFNAVSGPGVAVTPKTLPFVAAYQKKYGNVPAYSGYTAYDEVYMLADAIKRAGSTDSDKIVDAMETTDYEGTIGRVAFLPKGDPKVHGLRTGQGYITGLMLQWQDGKQLNMWPKQLAAGQMKFPSFVKLPTP